MPSRISVLFFILFLYGSSLAQRVDVIDNSGFTHNYVVGEVDYIELPADTARLKYVATIRISGKQTWAQLAAEWHYLFKIRAKELGANAMRCVNYSEDSLMASIDVRVYFAPESFLADNRNRRILNEIFVFNQARIPGDSGVFYMDARRVPFDAGGFCRLPANMDKVYLVKNNENDITARKVQFKTYKSAEFFIVPLSKRSVTTNWYLNNSPYAVSIGGVAVSFRKNKPIPLDYQLGRFMVDVYK